MESADARVAEHMAKPFARLTMRDPEGTYSARVVEFTGCFAGGDTEEEAARNLTEAMEAWIESELEEGRGIPEPAWAGEHSGNIRLRLPRSLHEQAAHRAGLDGVSLNQLFVAAIATYLGRGDALDDLGRQLSANLQVMVTAQASVTTVGKTQTTGLRTLPEGLLTEGEGYTTFDVDSAGDRTVNVRRFEVSDARGV